MSTTGHVILKLIKQPLGKQSFDINAQNHMGILMSKNTEIFHPDFSSLIIIQIKKQNY